MGKSAREIEERNRRTLSIVAENASGFDWQSNPFVGFQTFEIAGMAPFVMFSINDCHVVRAKVWNQRYEDLALILWADRARLADVVFDIGANTGLYSLTAASANPHAQIFAIEPLPEAASRTELNVAANEFRNISIRRIAIANAVGTVVLECNKKPYRWINTGGRIRSDKSPASPLVEQVPAQTDTLDNILPLAGSGNRFLLKVDVEGGEEAVLVGAKSLLHQRRPDILMEILSPDWSERLFRYLRPHDYRFYRILESEGRVVDEREASRLPYNPDDWNWFATADLSFEPSRYRLATG